MYILNTSILTGFGSFIYEPIEENRVVAEMQHYGFTSAIGHKGAADAINAVLAPYQIVVKVNRIQAYMKVNDTAIVFKLKSRIAEGTILNKQEVEKIGFEWGMITRTE